MHPEYARWLKEMEANAQRVLSTDPERAERVLNAPPKISKGKEILELRLREKLTLRQVAKRLGLDISEAGRAEGGGLYRLSHLEPWSLPHQR